MFLSLEYLLGIYRKSGILELGGEERAKGMVSGNRQLQDAGQGMEEKLPRPHKVTWVEESGCFGVKTSLAEGPDHVVPWTEEKIKEEPVKLGGKVK